VAAGTACTDTTPANCQAARCNSAGTCVQTYALHPPGTLCDDGSCLTYGDRCLPGGTCAGFTKTCPAPTACITGWAATCDGTPYCRPTYAPAGTPCNDGLGCTTGETCDGVGVCDAQEL
jgi:hypothetical protein